MTFMLAQAAGLIMTALAVAIAGAVLKAFLRALGRSLAASPVASYAAGSPNVGRFEAAGNTLRGSAWRQRAAA
ncbi:MAG TPA: hypothetical protein VNO70_11765 [Blastocatellia bacterium]|nr:hypothetical protein [Blastocatellia bacterium]